MHLNGEEKRDLKALVEEKKVKSVFSFTWLPFSKFFTSILRHDWYVDKKTENKFSKTYKLYWREKIIKYLKIKL